MRKHILIVEDDKFLSTIYERRFDIDGFNVSLARDGEEGLKLANQELPDCILLDILLPKLDGMKVLDCLKSNDLTKRIPVLLATNLGHKDYIDHWAERGAAGYLIKAHFKPSEIVRRVKEVLGMQE